MEMKRGIIDSDNYFREAFKPIIEPLSNQTEKNTQPADEIKPKTSGVSDYDNNNELNSSFSNFFNKRPTSKRYDKSYGMYYDKASDSYKIGGYSVTFSHGNLQLFNKYYPWTEGLWSLLCEKEPKNTNLQDMESYYNFLKTSRAHLKADGKPKTSKFHKWTNVVKPLYDRMKTEEKQLNEDINKINNSRTPRLSLAQITDHLSRSNTKRSNIHNNTTIPNDPFEFRPTANSSMTTDPKNEKMFNFTATPKVKRGSGLYKDVIPQTQLVYYDDRMN
ncbi:hypothetical protein AGLY_018108 [Aphis glycines]|uniref:DUF8207 domain-containing protein n=1 Tax=Aphis glycines TaxID=307491 RepID=A0A6G0ST72_APHGL|nr:hypothetical protein AGLY_018108 [Aphis glycines]